METKIPEKAKLLCKLCQCGFTVPDFIYVPASDFKEEKFEALQNFLNRHRESFKVIVRSAHPLEAYYKGGTFDSLETYSDLGGIKFARNRIIKYAQTAKRLSILRQQTFEGAPAVDYQQMGVIVMPFLNGSSVMAKKLWNRWEFGYCRDRIHKVQSEPYITQTPHDRKLLDISQNIQNCLGFPCEIEYIIGEDNQIFVVQAKNISQIEILEHQEEKRSLRLDGVRRIRKRRNYRERPVYVMDSQSFYLRVISRCEELVLDGTEQPADIRTILDEIHHQEQEMEQFSLGNRRFAILGLSIQPPEEIYQIANHYLDDTPELQQQLSKALYNHHYVVDAFLAEADTLIAKDKFRINLCGHDAYGIDTVRNPIWSVFWSVANHGKIIRLLRQLGFKTGDAVGIDINSDDKPTLYRL
ncbi:MAG: hypothetical protein WBN03_13735 [Desulfobacterales bacterium]